MKETYLKLLRIAAVIAAMFALVKEIFWFGNLSSGQGSGYIALYATVLVVAAVFAICHKSLRKLLYNPDLLIPLGLLLGFNTFVSLLPVENRSFDLFAGSWFGQFRHASPLLLFVWGANVIAPAVFAGWTIRMILQLGWLERVDAVLAFERFPSWFVRTLVVLQLFAVGQSTIGAALSYVLSPAEAIGTFVGVLLVIALNLASYAVLISVLNETDILPKAIFRGFGVSLRHVRRLWIVIVAQIFVLGAISAAHYEYLHKQQKVEVKSPTRTVVTNGNVTTRTDVGETRTTTTTFSTESRLRFHAKIIWTGGFNSESNWYSAFIKATSALPLAPVTLRFSFVLLLLALVLKIEIVRRIYGFRKEAVGAFGGDADWSEIARRYDVSNRRFLQAGIALLVFSAFLMLPVELILKDLKLGGLRLNSLLASERAMNGQPELVVPKIYRGENLIGKSEIFRFEKTEEQKKLPTGVVAFEAENEGVGKWFQKPANSDAWMLNEINAVYVGEVDDEPGADILVAGRDEALVLDLSGRLKKRIDYRLGSYRSNGDEQEYDFPFLKIVDLDRDGRPEIAGYGPDICQIIDLSGQPVWSYKGVGKGKDIDVDAMAVGDIDNDGVNEVIIAEGRDGKSSIEVYDQNARLKFRSPLRSSSAFEMVVSDFDGDGKNDLFVDSEIMNTDSRAFRDRRNPVAIYGALVSPDAASLRVTFEYNRLFLLNADDQALATYDAPLSFVYRKRYEDDSTGRAKFVNPKQAVFRASARLMRLDSAAEKYLVVLARCASDQRYAVLYVYDPAGELIYFETLASDDGEFITPVPQPDGTEHFLITDDGKLLEYSLGAR